MLNIVNEENKATYLVEWFEDEVHIFDCCSMQESDKVALENLEERYNTLNDQNKAEMRGMLHLLEDGLTNDYISGAQSSEVLLRIYEMFLGK